jgi:hypothetical protein
VMAAAEAAFRTWVEGGGRRDLAAMMAEAFDLLDAGLAALDESPPTTRGAR